MTLRIRVLTLFPRMFDVPLGESIVGRARARGLVSLTVHDLRDYALGRHRRVDDEPYGGGPGMVMRAEPLISAVEGLRCEALAQGEPEPLAALMSPQGALFDQSAAARLSRRPSLLLVCGHYGGVDERFISRCVDEELSIGDYVLTGGELAAMVVVDAVTRLLPGVVGNADSVDLDTFGAGAGGLLQGPVYTRPEEVEGMRVPPELLSGDHGRVEEWRLRQSVERTRRRRPDLLEGWPGG